jgi:hypothetical protein
MNPLAPVLSRRQFLQFTGISLFMTQFDGFSAFLPTGTGTELYQARALSAAPIYSQPNSSISAVTQLWPDSVYSLLAKRGEWYQLYEGYVHETAVQPMFTSTVTTRHFAPGTYASVTGPVAVLRHQADANATITGRIGHGGILRIADYLPEDIGAEAWLALADEDGTFLGWSQPGAWSPLSSDLAGDSQITRVIINRHTQQISAENAQGPLLKAPVTTGPNLRPGDYALSQRQLSAGSEVYHGLPYALYTGDSLLVAGAYWHNQFGRPTQEGHPVQLSPIVAAWLYAHLSETALIRVY